MGGSHFPAVDASAITPAEGNELFTLTPVIEDAVRTRFCVPGSVFLVEAIDITPLTKTGRWQVIRLLLGDGELCVQALLDGALHRFVQTGEVSVGCYVRVQHFELRWCSAPNEAEAAVAGQDEQQMVYLVLHDLTTIGWNETVAQLYRKEVRAKAASPADEELLEDIELKAATEPETPSKKPRDIDELNRDVDEDAELADAFDAFEALTFPANKATRQGQKAPHAKGSTGTSEHGGPAAPIALARDWHDPQRPLKLTTLRFIPHLPYAQNWSCNVLAIVVSLSPVEPSNLKPHKQRTARIVDPSTDKQVHLTVFLDPDEFTPAVGSAMLLTGVKNHRFDGGSLKKYANEGRAGARWWFEDPWELTWCDVAGIKRWWADMEAALGP